MNLSERIYNIIEDYIKTDGEAKLSFGDVLTEIVEFSDVGHFNNLSEEECVQRLNQWLEYCLSKEYIKKVEQKDSIDISNKEVLLKFLINKNKNIKLNLAINEHLKNVNFILNNNDYKSLEEYFFYNLNELNEYQEYTYDTLNFMFNEINYDDVYFEINNKSKDKFNIDYVKNILKDKKFTIKQTLNNCNEQNFYIKEFNIKIVFEFWN